MADEMKLLPCPFCGEPGKLIAVMGEWQGADKGYGPRGSRGVCSSEGYHCTAMAPSFHGPNQDADALAAWNRHASPPAREEAPAEGAGEIDGLRNRIKCLEKLAGEQSLRVMQQATRAKDAENELAALRDRTSEFAGEAVAWRRRSQDNHPWTFFDSEEDRKVYTSGDRTTRYSVQPLFTHPAPATADKLRVAKEALEGALPHLETLHSISALEAARSIVWREIKKSRQALATLNEEG